MTAPSSSRRADLDWIRVAAFGLLILYHVGLVYAPWDWHTHSPHTIDALKYAALAMNPWRLTLLFLVSGAALRFMSDKLPPLASLKRRFMRLAPPFLFGVIFLVPPQAWMEARDKFGFTQGLLAWWVGEFSPAGFAQGVPLNHLWFVLYIAAYSLVTIAIMSAPRVRAALEGALGWLLGGWRVLVLPFLYLTLVRQQMFSPWGITNHLTNDPYNHAMSYGVFLFGYLMARREQVWSDFERWRWAALAVAVVSLPALMVAEAMNLDWTLRCIVFAADQWATIAAILGFGNRYLRRAEGPTLRYLTDAVFPCYLAHQTILVAAAQALRPANLPVWIEPVVLVVATLGGSLLVYEIVRRIGPIRIFWGLRPLPRPAPIKAEPVLAANG